MIGERQRALDRGQPSAVGFAIRQPLLFLFARDLATVGQDAEIVSISARGRSQGKEQLASAFPIARLGWGCGIADELDELAGSERERLAIPTARLQMSLRGGERARDIEGERRCGDHAIAQKSKRLRWYFRAARFELYEERIGQREMPVAPLRQADAFAGAGG